MNMNNSPANHRNGGFPLLGQQGALIRLKNRPSSRHISRICPVKGGRTMGLIEGQGIRRREDGFRRLRVHWLTWLMRLLSPRHRRLAACRVVFKPDISERLIGKICCSRSWMYYWRGSQPGRQHLQRRISARIMSSSGDQSFEETSGTASNQYWMA